METHYSATEPTLESRPDRQTDQLAERVKLLMGIEPQLPELEEEVVVRTLDQPDGDDRIATIQKARAQKAFLSACEQMNALNEGIAKREREIAAEITRAKHSRDNTPAYTHDDPPRSAGRRGSAELPTDWGKWAGVVLPALMAVSGVVADFALGLGNLERSSLEEADSWLAYAWAYVPLYATFSVIHYLDPASIEYHRPASFVRFRKWAIWFAVAALAMVSFRLLNDTGSGFDDFGTETGEGIWSIGWTSSFVLQGILGAVVYLGVAETKRGWRVLRGKVLVPNHRHLIATRTQEGLEATGQRLIALRGELQKRVVEFNAVLRGAIEIDQGRRAELAEAIRREEESGQKEAQALQSKARKAARDRLRIYPEPDGQGSADQRDGRDHPGDLGVA